MLSTTEEEACRQKQKKVCKGLADAVCQQVVIQPQYYEAQMKQRITWRKGCAMMASELACLPESSASHCWILPQVASLLA